MIMPISSPTQKIQLSVVWQHTNRGYPAWVCRYGNIASESQKSPEKCFKALLKKLEAMGIDTSKISPIPKVIRKEVQNDD